MAPPLSEWKFAAGDSIAPDLVAMKKVGGGIEYEAYVAFDERLYAPVVVKVVRPDQVENEGTRADLRREAGMLLRLNHPSIVRMFAVDEAGPHPRLVLEHVDGPNLSALIGKHGALQLPQLLPLGIELASALHYLHALGICHLDVKPSNVIMGSTAKLIDFSCAREIDDVRRLVGPIGTDEYMAPEQCEPARGGLGHPADMWALGATMFRAGAGHRAFDHRKTRWPQLTESPRPLLGRLPPVLSELILACLDQDPARRPLPAEFADALEPLMANLPTSRLAGFKIG